MRGCKHQPIVRGTRAVDPEGATKESSSVWLHEAPKAFLIPQEFFVHRQDNRRLYKILSHVVLRAKLFSFLLPEGKLLLDH
jgi:hypothetical protein